MNGSAWVGRAMLAGIFIIFALGIAHVALDSLGLWARIPIGITRGVDIVTIAILGFELLGHLAILRWKVPAQS